MAQSAFAQDAWTRARDRFVEDLTEDEKRMYYQASVEMIFYDASAAEKEHKATSTGRSVMAKLQPLVDAITQYGQALDVYANAYPLVLSPLWGSLRVLLHLSREFSKYFDKIVDMFARIGDVLPRYQVYERLFSNHERLVHALSIAYVDVLKFCADAKAVFRRGRHSSLTNFRIAFKLIWKPFESQFGQQMGTFRQHQKTVEREAGLSHMIEAAKSRDAIRAHEERLAKINNELNRGQMISSLSDVKYENMHKRLQNLRHVGTGQWIIANPSYIEWKTSDGSKTVCCYGIPGSGKSILMSKIIDELGGEDCVAINRAYYYCDYADHRSLQTNQILGAILQQFFIQGLVSEMIELRIADAYIKGIHLLGEKEFKDILCSVVEKLSLVYIVIDGLDECEYQSRMAILHFLKRLTALRGPCVKIMVTCREADQMLQVLDLHTRIQLNQVAMAADIQSFVSSSVKSRIELGQLRIRNPALKQEIVTKLVYKARGMFLWIFFQLQDICEASSDAQIREALDNLPEGLYETYERIVMKIIKSLPKSRIAMRIFKWLLCARRPLLAGELREAVAFDTSDKCWEIDKIPDENLMMGSCQGLIVRDENDETVRFAHHTVQQYLHGGISSTQHRSSNHVILDFLCQLQGAEQAVGELCVTYLCFTDFETAITQNASDVRLTPTGILGPSGPGTIPTCLGLGKPIFDITYKLFARHIRPQELGIDYARYLKITANPPPPDVASKYQLLRYIIDNWAWHTIELSSDDTDQLSRAFDNLVMKKQLPFEFRPWGANRHFGPYGCKSCHNLEANELGPKDLPLTSMFHWASETGHLRILQKMPFDYVIHERYSNESMLIACRHGRTEVFEMLRSNLVDKQNRPDSFESPRTDNTKTLMPYLKNRVLSDIRFLNAACVSGNISTLHALLRLAEYDIEGEGHHALYLAATNGYVEIVRALLQNGAAPDVEDEISGRTPLLSATINCHKDVVSLLTKMHVDVNVKDISSGSTPLHYAAEIGLQPLVEVLLKSWASLESRNNSDLTPLLAATKAGHLEVVKLLLDHGSLAFETGGLYSLRHCGETYYSRLPALHWAAVSGHEKIVELLLDQGADIKNLAHHGQHKKIRRNPLHFSPSFSLESSAIHLAAYAGHPRVIQKLLDHGADIEATVGGSTARYFAIERGDSVAMQKLLGNDANIDIKSDGSMALHFATEGGKLEAMQKLLDNGANIEAGSCDGTALHIAIERGDLEAMQKLLDNGANIEVISDGMTVLYLATKRGNLEVMQKLLDNGADIEAKVFGSTALYHAMRFGHLEAKQKLLDNGADVKAILVETRTRLH